ncbi:MAG: hypothetical protein H0U04_05055 [Rubrobacter sp.]|nr:hypothetical protein [Rubrobacter sp.]
MKRIFLLLAMLAMVALTAAPALAQGQVERGPEHANSICSFSGLNDDPEEEGIGGGRTQSYGQIVGKLVKFGVNVNAGPGPAAPGTFCNGHLFPYPEAFEGMPEE